MGYLKDKLLIFIDIDSVLVEHDKELIELYEKISAKKEFKETIPEYFMRSVYPVLKVEAEIYGVDIYKLVKPVNGCREFLSKINSIGQVVYLCDFVNLIREAKDWIKTKVLNNTTMDLNVIYTTSRTYLNPEGWLISNDKQHIAEYQSIGGKVFNINNKPEDFNNFLNIVIFSANQTSV